MKKILNLVEENVKILGMLEEKNMLMCATTEHTKEEAVNLFKHYNLMDPLVHTMVDLYEAGKLTDKELLVSLLFNFMQRDLIKKGETR